MRSPRAVNRRHGRYTPTTAQHAKGRMLAAQRARHRTIRTELINLNEYAVRTALIFSALDLKISEAHKKTELTEQEQQEKARKAALKKAERDAKSKAKKEAELQRKQEKLAQKQAQASKRGVGYDPKLESATYIPPSLVVEESKPIQKIENKPKKPQTPEPLAEDEIIKIDAPAPESVPKSKKSKKEQKNSATDEIKLIDPTATPKNTPVDTPFEQPTTPAEPESDVLQNSLPVIEEKRQKEKKDKKKDKQQKNEPETKSTPPAANEVPVETKPIEIVEEKVQKSEIFVTEAAQQLPTEPPAPNVPEQKPKSKKEKKHKPAKGHTEEHFSDAVNVPEAQPEANKNGLNGHAEPAEITYAEEKSVPQNVTVEPTEDPHIEHIEITEQITSESNENIQPIRHWDPKIDDIGDGFEEFPEDRIASKAEIDDSDQLSFDEQNIENIEQEQWQQYTEEIQAKSKEVTPVPSQPKDEIEELSYSLHVSEESAVPAVAEDTQKVNPVDIWEEFTSGKPIFANTDEKIEVANETKLEKSKTPDASGEYIEESKSDDVEEHFFERHITPSETKYTDNEDNTANNPQEDLWEQFASGKPVFEDSKLNAPEAISEPSEVIVEVTNHHTAAKENSSDAVEIVIEFPELSNAEQPGKEDSDTKVAETAESGPVELEYDLVITEDAAAQEPYKNAEKPKKEKHVESETSAVNDAAELDYAKEDKKKKDKKKHKKDKKTSESHDAHSAEQSLAPTAPLQTLTKSDQIETQEATPDIWEEFTSGKPIFKNEEVQEVKIDEPAPITKAAEAPVDIWEEFTSGKPLFKDEVAPEVKVAEPEAQPAAEEPPVDIWEEFTTGKPIFQQEEAQDVKAEDASLPAAEQPPADIWEEFTSGKPIFQSDDVAEEIKVEKVVVESQPVHVEPAADIWEEFTSGKPIFKNDEDAPEKQAEPAPQQDNDAVDIWEEFASGKPVFKEDSAPAVAASAVSNDQQEDIPEELIEKAEKLVEESKKLWTENSATATQYEPEPAVASEKKSKKKDKKKHKSSESEHTVAQTPTQPEEPKPEPSETQYTAETVTTSASQDKKKRGKKAKTHEPSPPESKSSTESAEVVAPIKEKSVEPIKSEPVLPEPTKAKTSETSSSKHKKKKHAKHEKESTPQPNGHTVVELAYSETTDAAPDQTSSPVQNGQHEPTPEHTDEPTENKPKKHRKKKNSRSSESKEMPVPEKHEITEVITELTYAKNDLNKISEETSASQPLRVSPPLQVNEVSSTEVNDDGVKIVREHITANYELDPSLADKPTQFSQNVQKLVEQTLANSDLKSDDPNTKISVEARLIRIKEHDDKPKIRYVPRPITPLPFERHVTPLPLPSRERTCKLLPRDVILCSYMIDTHGENYENMSNDVKNTYRDNARGLQRKIRVFKESPHFKTYLKSKETGRTVEELLKEEEAAKSA